MWVVSQCSHTIRTMILKKVIRLIPIIKDLLILLWKPIPIISYDYADCCICFEKLQSGEECKIGEKCKHMFHEDEVCINKWFENSVICPICRRPGNYIVHQCMLCNLPKIYRLLRFLQVFSDIFLFVFVVFNYFVISV